MHTSDFYGVYLLRSTVKNAYYIGSTPDPRRRLRQHNGELSSGAYRTKRPGYRPWEMVIMVYGFPTKVQALQFEHAWQHAYQSRHIDGLGSRTNHGIHYRLGNLRKLLVANYFKRLVLEVAIMNRDILTLWDVNKFNGPHYQQVTYRTWDDFLQATVVPTVDLDDIQQELLRIVGCHRCHVAIDMINKRELVVKCRQFYHLQCLCKDDFIPAIITVDGQPYKWRDLLQTALKLRQYFDPNQEL